MSAQRKFATVEGKVVGEDHPDARFLIAAGGDEDEDADKAAQAVIDRLKREAEAAEAAAKVRSKRKFVTVEGKVVAEGAPGARFLASDSEGNVDSAFVAQVEADYLASVGKTPKKAEAPAVDATADEPDDDATVKAVEAPENKQAAPAPNKARRARKRTAVK